MKYLNMPSQSQNDVVPEEMRSTTPDVFKQEVNVSTLTSIFVLSKLHQIISKWANKQQINTISVIQFNTRSNDTIFSLFQFSTCFHKTFLIFSIWLLGWSNLLWWFKCVEKEQRNSWKYTQHTRGWQTICKPFVRCCISNKRLFHQRIHRHEWKKRCQNSISTATKISNHEMCVIFTVCYQLTIDFDIFIFSGKISIRFIWTTSQDQWTRNNRETSGSVRLNFE